jgi:hypothetical protein
MKPLVATVALAAASLIIILSPCLPESHEPLQRLSSEARGQALPTTLVLRIGAKHQIVGDVIDGRLTLVQAAALFGALNRLPPESMKPSLSDVYPSHVRLRAHTDEEWLCEQVVHWVSFELADRQDLRDATVARLEAEFKEALGNEGMVRLPDPLTVVPVQELLERAKAELITKGVVPPRNGQREDVALDGTRNRGPGHRVPSRTRKSWTSAHRLLDHDQEP